MDMTAKLQLARVGDSSDKAAGRRLAAAIQAIGMSKSGFAEASGQKPNAVINSTNGWSFPSKASIELLYREHRIDPIFIMFGNYSHLPSDVQERVFDALQALSIAEGKPANSG